MKKTVFVFGALLLVLTSASVAHAAATVTSATGGSSISADTCNSTPWTSLTGPVIVEAAPGDITTGTIVLTAPTGFEFNTAQDVTATVTAGDIDLGGGAGVAATATPLAGTVTFTVSTVSTATTTITLSSVQVRPKTGSCTVPSTGELTVSGGAGVSDTSAGTLTLVAGTLDHYAVAMTPTTTLAGVDIATSITAKDTNENTTVTGLTTTTVALTADGSSTVYPSSVTLTAGTWSGNLLLDKAGSPITLTGTGNTKTGTDTIVVTESKVITMSCLPSGQAGAVWLDWNEPAQTYTGLFTGYVVKTYAAALTDVNWASGTTFTQSWTPASATGGAVHQLVTGLNPNTRYYFGVMLGKSGDTIESLVSDPSPSCIAPASGTSGSGTDSTAPVSYITSPAASSTVQTAHIVAITGTARDTGGSSVQQVEVSLDGGATWNLATISNTDNATNVLWNYNWINPAVGSYTIKTRAYDWVGNRETPGTGVAVTISLSSTTTTTATTTTTTGTMTAEQMKAKITELRTILVQLLQKLVAMLLAQLH